MMGSCMLSLYLIVLHDIRFIMEGFLKRAKGKRLLKKLFVSSN